MKGSRGLGGAGEQLAAEHLLGLGYELLESNWHCRAGEIDLVMCDGEELVFVEVRTRRGDELGSPEESVNERKQERLRALALEWLAQHPAEREREAWRIDVVGVHLSRTGRVEHINHIPYAVGE